MYDRSPRTLIPLTGTKEYRCPGCNAFIVRALVTDGTVIQRKCRCKRLVEVSVEGVRVVERGGNNALQDWRCPVCKKLLLKYVFGAGAVMALKCPRQVCDRDNALACM